MIEAPSEALVPLDPPRGFWDSALADERASEAITWLATHFPECGGHPALDPQRHAVYEAAVAEDMERLEEALRDLMRAGRRVALERRSKRQRRQ